jgi:arsenical pump membrane protein
VAAGGVLVTGLPPAHDARTILGRIAPVLLFLVAITVVAQLAQNAGVFDAAAHLAARWGRGRTWLLWLLVLLLATAVTIVLSLDTTAVLLTPVALALAAQIGISPALFAMTTVWLADTASMLLPVSNLTNLLALHRFDALGLGLRAYVSVTWLPALVAIVVTVAVLAAVFRRDLRLPYEPPRQPPVEDRVLLIGSATVCLLLAPAFATGITPAWPATAAAVVLVVLFAVRRPSDLRASHVPWRLVLLVIGLFFVVQALTVHGLAHVLAHIAGRGESWPDHLRLAWAGALGANAVDNLPAYLALEPVADGSPGRLVGPAPRRQLWTAADLVGLPRHAAVARALPRRGRRRVGPALSPARAPRRTAGPGGDHGGTLSDCVSAHVWLMVGLPHLRSELPAAGRQQTGAEQLRQTLGGVRIRPNSFAERGRIRRGPGWARLASPEADPWSRSTPRSVEARFDPGITTSPPATCRGHARRDPAWLGHDPGRPGRRPDRPDDSACRPPPIKTDPQFCRYLRAQLVVVLRRQGAAHVRSTTWPNTCSQSTASSARRKTR